MRLLDFCILQDIKISGLIVNKWFYIKEKIDSKRYICNTFKTKKETYFLHYYKSKCFIFRVEILTSL